MKKKAYVASIVLLSASTPFVAWGAQTIQGLIAQVLNFLYLLFWPLFGVALFLFFWGIVMFIFKEAEGDKAREQAKKRIVWGIVALFVLTSVWGIVGFLGDLFGITQGGACSPTQLTSGGVTSCVTGGGYTAGSSLKSTGSGGSTNSTTNASSAQTPSAGSTANPNTNPNTGAQGGTGSGCSQWAVDTYGATICQTY